MNPSDIITLQALLLALSQMDVPLPEHLRQEVNALGDQLIAHQPGTIEQIHALVKHHERLNELFNAEYRRLQEHYETQERARNLVSSESTLDGTPLTWRDITKCILTAHDFRAAAESLLKRVKANQDTLNASGDVRVFISALQRVVSGSHSRSTAFLKALEKQSLTVRHLSPLLELSLEQTQAIAQSLWNDGYIERTTGSLLYNLFPMLRTQRHQEVIDPDTYLTLTSRGHFHLHPVLVLGRREDRNR